MNFKFKKLIGNFLSVSMLLMLFGTTNISANDNTIDVISLEELETLQKEVDVLLDERVQLLFAGDNNEELLKANEEELNELGMELCNASSAINNQNDINVCAIISGNEELTIGDYSTAYRGKIYDLRVIKVLPANKDSTSCKVVEVDNGNAKSTIEKTGIYISTIVDAAVGLFDGGAVSVVLSVAEAFAEAISTANLTDIQVKEGSSFNYEGYLSAEDTFVFVKKNGESNNNYVYCYNANKVRIEYYVEHMAFVKNSSNVGGYITKVEHSAVQTVKAANYDYIFSKACEVYYNADSNNYFQNIAKADHLSYVTYNISGYSFNVPMPQQAPFPGEYQYN